MIGKKVNTAVWTAGIGGAATIIAALIATFFGHGDGHDGGNGAAGSTKTAGPASGIVRTLPGYVSVFVYGSVVQDPATNRIGQLSDGQHVEIVCTVQGPVVAGGATGKTTTVWDKIKYNSGYGFVSDTHVFIDTEQAAPPPCYG
jgi:hypothetical protein